VCSVPLFPDGAVSPFAGTTPFILSVFAISAIHIPRLTLPFCFSQSQPPNTMCISYWQLLHTVMHHTYTNMDNDPDLYHYVFFLRDHANYPYRILHRLQVCMCVCFLCARVWVAVFGRMCWCTRKLISAKVPL